MDKALYILRSTNDGNDLAPVDLKLVESACNGFLNEKGEEAFDALYQRVKSGDYQVPFLHGIQHLTVDHEGYVYWKGFEVEHYDSPYKSESKKDLQLLAKRCESLEKIGVEVCTKTSIWYWDWFNGISAQDPYLKVLRYCPAIYVNDQGDCLLTRHESDIRVVKSGKVAVYPSLEAVMKSFSDKGCLDDSMYHMMQSIGFKIPDAGQRTDLGLCYASWRGVVKLLQRHEVPSNVFDL